MTQREKNTDDICARLERGELNEAQAFALLATAGTDPAHAREIIHIALGGSDIVGDAPEPPTPPNQKS